MIASILSFTRRGARLSLKIKKVLDNQGYQVDCYTLPEYAEENNGWLYYEPNLESVAQKVFRSSSVIVFVSACGIAVRIIAPLIKDKITDPAVICLDELGKNVIPLLSGHLGGANSMARVIAYGINAYPVITTATDINGLLAVDEWAVRNELVIANFSAAKRISASLVDGEKVGFYSDFMTIGQIPKQMVIEEKSQVGMCISLDEFKRPYDTTLNLIPRIVCLGIGCRRNTKAEVIEELVLKLLDEHGISIKAVAGVASIDLKEDEPGLLQFADKYSLPLTFYSAGDLESVPGNFAGSSFVKQIAGIDNVCERAAVLLSHEGTLICGKTVKNGVTAALALKRWRVNFED